MVVRTILRGEVLAGFRVMHNLEDELLVIQYLSLILNAIELISF